MMVEYRTNSGVLRDVQCCIARHLRMNFDVSSESVKE